MTIGKEIQRCLIFACVLLGGCAARPPDFEAEDDTATQPGDNDSDRKGAEESLAECQDGLDNDGDGLTDCDDDGCSVFVFCADTDTGPDGDTDTDVDTDIDSDTDLDTDTDSDTDTDTDADGDLDSDTDTDGETDTGPDSDTTADSEVDTEGLSDNQTSAYFVNNAPVIDGDLNEPYWTPLTRVQKRHGDTDNSARFDVVWDMEKLYIAVWVTDRDLCIGYDEVNHHYDSFEVYIDPDNSKSHRYDDKDLQVIFKYVDEDFLERGDETINPVAVEMRGSRTQLGYSGEVAIPWAGLGVVPRDGLVVGFDIGVNDDDPPCTVSGAPSRDGELKWMGDANNYTDTSNFGELVLFATALDPDTDTDTDSGGGTDSDSSTETAAPRDSALTVRTPPVIDGALDEAVWRLDTPVDKVVAGRAGDTIGYFDALWDETRLYVAVRVEDDSICVGNDAMRSYLYDSIEIYIDPDNSKSSAYDGLDAQVILKYTDDGNWDLGDFSNQLTEVVSRGRTIDGGYEVEASILWRDLQMIPSADTVIGFDIGVNDDDAPCTIFGAESRDGELRWSGTAENFETTEAFGELVLLAEAADPERDTETETDSASDTDSSTGTDTGTDPVDAGPPSTRPGVGRW